MAGMYTAQMRIPSGPNQVRPQQVMGNSPSMTFPPNGAHVVFQQTPGQVPLYTIYQTPSGPHQQMQQGQSVRYQVPFYQQQQPMYSQPTFMPAGLPPAGYYPGNYSYNQQQPGPAQQQQYVAQQQQQPFAASFPPPANPIYASAPPMSTNTSQHQNAMGTHTGPVVAQPGMGGAPQQQPNYNTTMYNSVQTQPPPPDPQHGNQGGQGVQLQGPGAARPRAKNVLAIVDPNTLEVQNKEAVEEAQKSTVEPETASGRTSAESFAQAPSTNAATAGADSAHESRASDQSTVDGRPGIAQEFMRNVAQVAFEPDAAVPAAAQPAASAVSPVASAAAAVDQPPHSPAVIMDEERNDTIDSVEFAYDSPDARSNDKQVRYYNQRLVAAAPRAAHIGRAICESAGRLGTLGASAAAPGHVAPPPTTPDGRQSTAADDTFPSAGVTRARVSVPSPVRAPVRPSFRALALSLGRAPQSPFTQSTGPFSDRSLTPTHSSNAPASVMFWASWTVSAQLAALYTHVHLLWLCSMIVWLVIIVAVMVADKSGVVVLSLVGSGRRRPMTALAPANA
uniref:Uncharacterized protein n=1 Tax=Plectus sambesii TaxID=2011161 RepID=A0A914X4U9_9BILA